MVKEDETESDNTFLYIGIAFVIVICVLLAWLFVVKPLMVSMSTGTRTVTEETSAETGTETSTDGETQVETSSNVSLETSADDVTQEIMYPDQYEVPTQQAFRNALTSRSWNALITTFPSPGMVAEYTQVTGEAFFTQENGQDVKMELTWLGDNDEYVFGDWQLKSNMSGFSVTYPDNSLGYYLYAIIVRKSDTRFDINIYGEENALKRFIVLTA